MLALEGIQGVSLVVLQSRHPDVLSLVVDGIGLLGPVQFEWNKVTSGLPYQ